MTNTDLDNEQMGGIIMYTTFDMQDQSYAKPSHIVHISNKYTYLNLSNSGTILVNYEHQTHSPGYISSSFNSLV